MSQTSDDKPELPEKYMESIEIAVKAMAIIADTVFKKSGMEDDDIYTTFMLSCGIQYLATTITNLSAEPGPAAQVLTDAVVARLEDSIDRRLKLKFHN